MRDRIAARLLRESLHNPLALLAAILCVSTLGVAQLYLTWLAKRLVDGPLVTGDVGSAWEILARALIATIVGATALLASRILLARIDETMIERLRNRAVEGLLHAPLAGVRSRTTGEWISRVINDTAVLSGFVSVMVKRVMREGVVIAGATLMLFLLHWRLAAAVFLLVPLTAFVLDRAGRRIRSWSRRAQQDVGSMTAILAEQIQGLTTIRGFQTEARESARFAAHNAAQRKKAVGREGAVALLMSGVFVVTGSVFLLIVGYGVTEVTSGAIEPGVLLAFCLYSAQIVEPLRRLSEINGVVQTGLAAASRTYEVIDLEPPRFAEGRPWSLEAAPSVSFDRVSFTYEGKAVLKEISFSIGAGECIGIVAASGGGKSTLASLLPRFREADSGAIVLGGLPLGEWPVSRLRDEVCVVEQEPFVFDGTLAENIRYGRADASDQDVVRATDLAGLKPLIETVGGLNGHLTEAGRNLSGGEKQRIALARAIVKDPGLLVLDEATSALDSESEAALFERLQPWLRRRTTIVMAHRLSTILRSDRVLVMSEGRVVAEGAREQIVARSTEFQSLFADQLRPRA